MKRFLTLILLLGLHAAAIAADLPGNNYEESLLETIKEIQRQDRSVQYWSHGRLQPLPAPAVCAIRRALD